MSFWNRIKMSLTRFMSGRYGADQLCLVSMWTAIILTLLGSGTPYEETLPWMLETGIFGGSLPEKKYLLKLNLRLALEPGSHLRILVQYDSLGPWVELGHLTGGSLRSFTLPVKPRRCDHLRLRLEGRGDVGIYSIVKTMERGSDRM